MILAKRKKVPEPVAGFIIMAVFILFTIRVKVVLTISSSEEASPVEV